MARMMSKRGNKKQFRKSAGKTHVKNLHVGSLKRGGERL